MNWKEEEDEFTVSFGRVKSWPASCEEQGGCWGLDTRGKAGGMETGGKGVELATGEKAGEMDTGGIGALDIWGKAGGELECGRVSEDWKTFAEWCWPSAVETRLNGKIEASLFSKWLVVELDDKRFWGRIPEDVAPELLRMTSSCAETWAKRFWLRSSDDETWLESVSRHFSLLSWLLRPKSWLSIFSVWSLTGSLHGRSSGTPSKSTVGSKSEVDREGSWRSDCFSSKSPSPKSKTIWS